MQMIGLTALAVRQETMARQCMASMCLKTSLCFGNEYESCVHSRKDFETVEREAHPEAVGPVKDLVLCAERLDFVP
jgi:hypothetical protein